MAGANLLCNIKQNILLKNLVTSAEIVIQIVEVEGVMMTTRPTS